MIYDSLSAGIGACNEAVLCRVWGSYIGGYEDFYLLGSSLKLKRRFGETCGLHLQCRRVRQARNQRESRWQAKPAWHILRPWRRRRHVPSKHRLTFNELHSAIYSYQKTVLFITLRCLNTQVVDKLKCWEAPHVIVHSIAFFCRSPVP
jgi:hypothetical protein